jgi:hypothetical protein
MAVEAPTAELVDVDGKVAEESSCSDTKTVKNSRDSLLKKDGVTLF